LIVALLVYESRYDELVTSTEFMLYKIDEWDEPSKVIRLEGKHFAHLDFVGCTAQRSLCFFVSQGRIFHISDFDTLVEVSLESAKVRRWPTDGLSAIFGTSMEHLAKNTSGAWHNDQFYLYTTPNPAVVQLEHFFVRLCLETKQWRQMYLNGPQFVDIVEVHMSVNRDAVMVLDCRNAADERNIHRVPLGEPESLLHLSQFAVNRRFGSLAEMTVEQRQSRHLPTQLCIPPAFDHQHIQKHSLSTKDSKIVVSDALYG